jgi:hypothetical protein
MGRNHGTASSGARKRGPHDLYVEFQAAVLRQLPRPSELSFEGLTKERMKKLISGQAGLKALLREAIIQQEPLFRDELEKSLSLDIVWGSTLAKMLTGCNFFNVYPDVTDRHFWEEGGYERHAHRLVNLMDFSMARVKGNLMTWQVLEEMHRVKRSPGGLEELLAFRRKHQEFPKRGMCIVALDSFWRDEKGYLLSPCMHLDKSDRPVLSLCNYYTPWSIPLPPGYNFSNYGYRFISVGPVKEES